MIIPGGVRKEYVETFKQIVDRFVPSAAPVSKRSFLKPDRAFTLIELLVVIAIIAILAAMLLPVLAKSKLKATESACLNNQKEMGLAFTMYVNDNNDNLVQSHVISGGQPGAPIWPAMDDAGGFWGINPKLPPLSGAGASQGTALADDENELITNNLLGQYTRNPEVFHCPGDARFNLPIGSGNAIGWAFDSYALSENVESCQGFTESFSKVSQIRRVSDCIIFVEQSDTRGFNQDTFAMSVNGPLPPITFNFVDIFATYHGDVGTFAFADGHAEPRTWLDPAIRAAGTSTLGIGSSIYDYQLSPNKPDPSGHDAPWLIQHCVAPNNQ